MATTDDIGARTDDLTTATLALVRRWLSQTDEAPADAASTRLNALLGDPEGLPFAVGFVDGVARPDDVFVGGYALEKLARATPAFLSPPLRAAVKAGGVLGPVLPWLVVPAARRALRALVGHLVVDARPERLTADLERLRSRGDRLNLNLLGEAVLGEDEARRRRDAILALLQRDDVDYVSVKVSSVVPQLSMWAFDEMVDLVVERLGPLYDTGTFLNLDMEEYRDLDLTLAVFQRILDDPSRRHLCGGIVLQAYLPDSFAALQRLTAWAQSRVAAGGAPIKVRIVKGANLPLERVAAALHGWPVAPYGEKVHTDANYKRLLEWVLTPERAAAVQVGVAGHNLFDLAHAWLLAQRRGVEDRVEVEMLLGMAAAQEEAIRRDVGRLLLYTPVVDPAEFDVAISYLVRRLEENASPENFLSAVASLGEDPALFDRERDRFLAAVDELDHTGLVPQSPHRTQDRTREAGVPGGPAAPSTTSGLTRPRQGGDTGAFSALPSEALQAEELAFLRTPARPDDEFGPGLTSVVLGLARGSAGEGGEESVPLLAGPAIVNAPDTDPALAANRAWGRDLLSRAASSTVGAAALGDARLHSVDDLDRVVTRVREAAEHWAARPAADRAAVLHRAGRALAARRGDLIEVLVAEGSKTLAEADPEVSEAVDFAHYYADRGAELDAVHGAVFVPARVTVVAPPWNFPVAIPAGGVLAALAAGSGAVLKPAPQARRSAAAVAETLWAAGVPRDLLALVDIDEDTLGRPLITHDAVDRVLLTGSWETAALFRSWRPDLPLLAETSGKNAIVVTPSADIDLAVADIVTSAFGHAGQKCSAASLLILVGSMGRSRRFLRQLVDAAGSLRVGAADRPETAMGPLIEPASGKLLHALTGLGAHERWLLEPRRLDEEGRLWSPGIRDQVQPGSYAHLTEFFGPVLSVIRAGSLAEAIRYQNAVDYGLTGLHSLNPAEVRQWIEGVEAGNLSVNRAITGAIVGRQPFGGWKRSTVGPGGKAGGPNHLFALGDWVPETGRSSATLHLRGLEPIITALIEGSQSSLDYHAFDRLRRAALSDAVSWATDFAPQETAGLEVERNVLRYRPVPVAVRAAEGAQMLDLLRVLSAALLARSEITVSASVPVPERVLRVLRTREIPVFLESDAEWQEHLTEDGPGAPRIRLIGGDATATAHALGGSLDVSVWADAVTGAGRVELLPFLREQTVSVTAHRFGTPLPAEWGAVL